MSFTISPYFGQTVVAEVLANSGALAWLSQQFQIQLGNPRPGYEGNITLRIATSAAAQTASSTAILGANGANTTVTLTGKTVISIPWEVQEHQLDALEVSGMDLAPYMLLCASECMLAVQNDFIADAKAATATVTSTLTTGQARFHAESAVEQLDNEEKLWLAIAPVLARKNGDFGKVAIFMETSSFARFMAGRAFAVQETKLQQKDGMFQFFGIPIFTIPGDETDSNGAVNWGEVSQPCAFVLGWEGYGLRMSTMPPTRIVEEPDNFTRMKCKLPYWHGVAQETLLGEVISGSS